MAPWRRNSGRPRAVTNPVHCTREGGLRAAFFFLQNVSMAQAVAYAAFCSLLVASFSMPNHYPPWGAAQQDMVAAAAGMLLLAAVSTWGQGLTWSAASLFFFALACVPMLQFVVGKVWFFGDAWVSSLYLLSAGTAVLSGHAAQRDGGGGFAPTLAGCLLAAGLLGCVLALAQRFHVDWGPLALFLIDVQPGRAPFANLAQPNQLATLLVVALGSLLFLYERRLVRAAGVVVAAMLLVCCTALTQSRASLLLLLCLAAWHFVFASRLKLRTPVAIHAAILGLWIAAYLSWPAYSHWAALGDVASIESRLEVGPRAIIWQQLLEAVLLQPWSGYGWNQVSVAQVAVAADSGLSRFTEHSHNLLLDLALWCGVPLAALIVVGCALWGVARARAVRSLDAGFALLIVLVLMTHSVVEFPLDYLYFLIPFGWAVGILERECSSRPVATMRRLASILLTALCAVLVVGASVDYLRFEESYRDLRYTVGRVGKPTVFAGEASPVTQFTQLGAFYRYALVRPQEGMTTEEREWMRRVAVRFPYVPALYRLAVVQGLHGETHDAARTMRTLRQLHGEAHYATAKQEFRRLAATGFPKLSNVLLP